MAWVDLTEPMLKENIWRSQPSSVRCWVTRQKRRLDLRPFLLINYCWTTTDSYDNLHWAPSSPSPYTRPEWRWSEPGLSSSCSWSAGRDSAWCRGGVCPPWSWRGDGGNQTGTRSLQHRICHTSKKSPVKLIMMRSGDWFTPIIMNGIKPALG